MVDVAIFIIYISYIHIIYVHDIAHLNYLYFCSHLWIMWLIVHLGHWRKGGTLFLDLARQRTVYRPIEWGNVQAITILKEITAVDVKKKLMNRNFDPISLFPENFCHSIPSCRFRHHSFTLTMRPIYCDFFVHHFYLSLFLGNDIVHSANEMVPVNTMVIISLLSRDIAKCDIFDIAL